MAKEPSAKKLQLNFHLNGDLFRVVVSDSFVHVVWYAPHMKLADTQNLAEIPDEARSYITMQALEYDIKLP
jgi:hypothetical protein